MSTAYCLSPGAFLDPFDFLLGFLPDSGLPGVLTRILCLVAVGILGRIFTSGGDTGVQSIRFRLTRTSGSPDNPGP